jgi:hypothetical protein
VLASHTRMVVSEDPDAIFDPSAEKATQSTERSWPSSGGSSLTPMLASHARIVASPDLDTIIDPSGESATQETYLS